MVEVFHDAPAAASITLLHGGREAFPRMLHAIREARQSVHLEVYHLAREGVGDEFRRALSEAALRGVRVRVILDGWGSALDGRWLQAMLEADGAEVRIYHPLSALFTGRFRRNHRKILLVDGRVAYLGGINIADEYGQIGPGRAPDLEDDQPEWMDLAVEIRGAPAAWLEARLRGERPPRPPGPVQIHLSGIGGGGRLRNIYRRAFGAARTEILAAHAYFLPDRRFVRSVTASARRGVKVTLLLAGRSDVPLARAGTVRLYRRLSQSGVEIREWTRSVHHAKVAVVDGAKVLLGSFNLDPFSLANLESLVEIDDPETAAAARRWFEERAAQARLVSPEEAERGGLTRRLADAVGRTVARFAEWVARLLSGR
ncbi:MAG: phospholipase D-like domain-containing protein [Deltaproteobacteria bacterium]|nr:phospholipase D-like domain-containing protein [Deltaproteobacteria bacterium]